MNISLFKESFSQGEPRAGSSVYLAALWYDANNDWEKAHRLIQDLDDSQASWIHAYLHRKEGDTGNADYWYRRANKKRPGTSLPDEWEELLNAFL